MCIHIDSGSIIGINLQDFSLKYFLHYQFDAKLFLYAITLLIIFVDCNF
jgi:hypothetical protein